MNSTRTLQLLFLSAAVAGLSACGGGGGSDAATTGAPAPAPAPGSPPPPAPAPTSSGLPAATASLSQSASTAAGLAAKAADVYKKSAGAAAAVALGGAAPVAGSTSVACAGGGSVAYSGPATGMTATYNACVLGVHTFAGSATVSYVASGSTVQSYVIDYSNGGVNVSAPNGFGATLTGRTSCDSSSGTRLCVADYQNVRWGNDFEYDYAGNLANGSTACDCTASQIVLVQAANLGATSGVANVTGASGSAVVTRTSATAFTVNLTAGGVTVSYPVTVTSP